MTRLSFTAGTFRPTQVGIEEPEETVEEEQRIADVIAASRDTSLDEVVELASEPLELEDDPAPQTYSFPPWVTTWSYPTPSGTATVTFTTNEANAVTNPVT